MVLRPLFIIILIQVISESNTKITDTRENPVDILKLKHIQLNEYNHHPLNAKHLQLFENVETLMLKNCNFTVLSEDIVVPLPKLEKLTFMNTVFQRQEHNVSHCCRRLKELELINSGLPNFPWDKVEEEWPLERLYLSKEKIPALEANNLDDTNLKELTIEHSGVKTIDDAAFAGLGELEILNLQGNEIKTLNSKILEPLKGLKTLNLSNNLLEKLSTDQFPSLPNLEEIDVGHNPIKEINLQGIKKLAPKLKKVDISGIEGVDTSKNGGVNFSK